MKGLPHTLSKPAFQRVYTLLKLFGLAPPPRKKFSEYINTTNKQRIELLEAQEEGVNETGSRADEEEMLMTKCVFVFLITVVMLSASTSVCTFNIRKQPATPLCICLNNSLG